MPTRALPFGADWGQWGKVISEAGLVPLLLLPPACPASHQGLECHSRKAVTTTLRTTKETFLFLTDYPALGILSQQHEEKQNPKQNRLVPLYLYRHGLWAEAGCSNHGLHMDLRDFQGCLLQKLLLSLLHLGFILVCVMPTVCDCQLSSHALALDTRTLPWALSTVQWDWWQGTLTSMCIEKDPPACTL